jgi:glycosyltransferase involved in cell wall biosynthesis
MAAGKPIVLAIDGVIRQVVEDAGGGIFVPPGNPQAVADAIRSLAMHPENAKQLGLNGRSYVAQHFAREQLTSELMSVIDRLVENHGSKNIDR